MSSVAFPVQIKPLFKVRLWRDHRLSRIWHRMSIYGHVTCNVKV